MKLTPNQIAMNYQRVEARNKKAVDTLRIEYGIDFTEFRYFIGWKASAYTLLGSIRRENPSTMHKVHFYYLKKVAENTEATLKERGLL